SPAEHTIPAAHQSLRRYLTERGRHGELLFCCEQRRYDELGAECKAASGKRIEERKALGGFFYKLGRFLGHQSRKANWAFRSLTGTEAEAVRAETAVGHDLARDVLEQTEADPDPEVA